MISEDRIQLNERFKQVFSLLEERGEIIKNDRNGKGMGDFAEKILGTRSYGHIIRAFLNDDDKRVINFSQARKLCREYGVNETYLLDGDGSPFGVDLPDPQTVEGGYRANILFTSTQAFAGATETADSFEENTLFAIPGLQGGGSMVAFPINGNSMEPVIQNGDIVICNEVDSVDSIRDNEIYAVRDNGKLWVKYVQKIPNTKNRRRVERLKLISANHLEHDPFEVEVSTHTKLYKVVRRISEM